MKSLWPSIALLLLIADFCRTREGTHVLTRRQTQLTVADRLEILDAHNYFRGMVDPPAANIQRLVNLSSTTVALSTVALRK